MLERLDVVAYGSPEWGRLMGRRDQLVKQIIDALPPPPPPASEISELTDAELIERHEKLLAELKAERDFRLTGKSQHYAPSATTDDTDLDVASVNATSTPAPPPEPEVWCHYCGTSAARCEARQSSDLATWRVLHARDPQEVKRKNKALTAEMLAMIGRPIIIP